MSEELTTLIQLADNLSIIAILLIAWTWERQERKETQTQLLKAKDDITAKVESHLTDAKTRYKPVNTDD